MRTLTITHSKGWYGRFRAAKILADDIEIGSVGSGETIDVQLPDQTRNLYVKMDRGHSAPRESFLRLLTLSS